MEGAVINVENSGQLWVSGGTLNVEEDGTLTVESNAVINVENSGKLYVFGTLNVEANAVINVENSGQLWVSGGKLDVMEGAVFNVKDSGTLSTYSGMIYVNGSINVEDDGKITYSYEGTLNVNGRITLGSTAEIVGADPDNPPTIVIEDEGKIIADPTDPGWTSNFYDKDGRQELPTAGKTYKWTEDLNGDGNVTTDDSGWKATT
jgi:hypothetical protein